MATLRRSVPLSVEEVLDAVQQLSRANGYGFLDLAVANFFYPGTLSVLLNAADWGGGN